MEGFHRDSHILYVSNAGHSTLVAMALLLRGEMKFLWQHREEALQDLERVAEMTNTDTEVSYYGNPNHRDW